MNYLKAFVAGFLATLWFHQLVLAILHTVGPAPAPFNMQAVGPFGVPAVFSLAFWGGVWGLPFWWWLKRQRDTVYYLHALIFGALGPSAVALLVVFPLKGMPIAGGGEPRIIIGALLLNGAWGLGAAALLRVLRGRKL